MRARGGPRAINLVSAYWDAAGSGRFFTRWSAIASLPISALLLAPLVGGRPSGYGPGVAAALISWMILAVPVLAVAATERRMKDHTSRSILITVTIALVAAARPALNEGLVLALYADHSAGIWAARIGTNLVVAFGLFTLIAIITTEYEQTRATADRLASALGRLDAANRLIASGESDARLVIRAIVAELRIERDAMLAGRIDFDAVRGFSERVRAASHRLEQMAEVTAPVPAIWSPRSAPLPQGRGIERLRPTPLLWVGLLYVVMCVPFLLTIADIPGIIASIVAVLLIDLAAGAVLRALPTVTARTGGIAVLLVWVLAGTATATVGYLLLPAAGVVTLTPIVALPLAAIVFAIAIDTRRRAYDEERNSTRELACAAGAYADRVRHAQAPLRQAASVLHGRVQGRCVIFAAHVDEATPTEDDIARFRVETDRALDEVLAPASSTEADTGGELRRMLAGWEALMALETHIDGAAVPAVEAAESAPAVTEVVNEALVNAVKHSGARAARIDITAGEGAVVHVRVVSAGSLPRAIMPIRSFAGPTLLYQDGDDVVLESTLPAPALVDGLDVAGASVVEPAVQVGPAR